LSVRRKAVNPLIATKRMRRGLRKDLADTFTAENKPMLFSVANYLQSIPFEVHAPTLTAIKRVWGSGGSALGVPCRNVPDRPPFPFGEGWNKDEAPEEELDTFLR